MKLLKHKLIIAPLLCKIHYFYKDEWREIIVNVNASLIEWRDTFKQMNFKGKRKVTRYKFKLWNSAEQKYDAIKRKCRDVLKCFKKLQFFVYEIFFILKTDAKTLVAQLNKAVTDLFEALMIQWLIWIKLFDFEMRHIDERIHTTLDELFKRLKIEIDEKEERTRMNIDEWIVGELNVIEVVSEGVSKVRSGELNGEDEDCKFRNEEDKLQKEEDEVSEGEKENGEGIEGESEELKRRKDWKEKEKGGKSREKVNIENSQYLGDLEN